MLQRTLSALVLVLALLSGAVLLTNTYDIPFVPKVFDRKPASEKRERPTSDSSGILSRFALLPGARQPVPFAVVIENHEDARVHQTGLQDALMVQEFLVEGFISRFVALFNANALPREIGPARSLRPYFLDGIKPWARTVYHAGGSPEALERVTEGEEFFARNLLYFDDENKETGSLRKKGVPAPHDLFLRKKVLKSFLSEVPTSYKKPAEWPPFPVGTPEGGESAQSLRVNFFNVLHTVYFEYLPLAQKYKRTNGKVVSDARPANVLILEVPIDYIGAYGRLFMTLEGSGSAQLFHSGKMWPVRWSRGSDSEPFKITDAAGAEVPFAHGQIWMMVLPTLERVSWEA